MGISTFPAPDTGGQTNDFIVDKNGTTNTDFIFGRSFAAGGYSIAVTGSTAYDIYLLDANGSSVGYSNGTSIVASSAFETASILGLGTADTVAFTYSGPSTNATTTGQATGAGAFLTSISPSDLPQIDDTAIVSGGNFASGVEISFVSGTVTKAAKNVVVGSSTALVVTRPDDLIEDLAPYDLKAINPGITAPSSGVNVLSGTVTAGTDPSFVTTSPILGAGTGTAFSTAILVSDSEGTVVNWQITSGSLPTGLALATATGVISGTPTQAVVASFTVQITDDGGNTNSANFTLPVGAYIQSASGSAVETDTHFYYVFTSAGDVVIGNSAGAGSSVEYLVIAGGGASGGKVGTSDVRAGSGGGGAGGLLNGFLTGASDGTASITVGAGGATSTGDGGSGSNSTFGTFVTAFGGGGGGQAESGNTGVSSGNPGLPGGSGGGGASGNSVNAGETSGAGGAGTAGQGNAGGSAVNGQYGGAGGGGAAVAGSNGNGSAGVGGEGGDGSDFGAWASAIGIIYDGGYFAGGGSGGGGAGAGLGGGTSKPNSGGGGNGITSTNSASFAGQAGNSGLVVLRSAK